MEEKNYKKYIVFLLPVVILLVVLLFTKSSFAVETVNKNIYLNSENADYQDEEYNSWQLHKSAKWINNKEAEIRVDVKSYPFDTNTTDYIFMLDLTDYTHKSVLNNFIGRFIWDESYSINPTISVIGFADESNYIVSKETDLNVVGEALNNVGTVNVDNVDYYSALLKLESLLRDYNLEEGKKIKVVFIGKPYEGTTVYNQEEEFDYIKEQYPNIEVYFTNTGDISTNGFLNKKADYIGNDIELLTAASVINEFVITDYIDTRYFEYEEVLENNYKFIAFVNCWSPARSPETRTKGIKSMAIGGYCSCDGGIKKSQLKGAKVVDEKLPFDEYDPCEDDYLKYQMNNLVVDEETGKITWDLSNSIYSTNATLRIKVKLKDEYLDSDQVFTTNTSTEVESNLADIEEDISTTDSPKLKQKYKITYEGNMPEGCYFEPVVETHSVFSEVNVLEAPNCSGFEFKGWGAFQEAEIDPNDYYTSGASEHISYEEWLDWIEANPDYYYDMSYIRHLSDKFTMPDSDLVIKGTWGRVGVDKHFEGDEFGSYSLYSVETKSLQNATEIDTPEIINRSTVTQVSLNTLDAIAEYEVTAVNLSDVNYRLVVSSVNTESTNMEYEIEEPVGVSANSSTKFTLRLKYKDGLTELPENTNYSLQLFFKFVRDGAMFDTGSNIATKMRTLSGQYANYNYSNNRITTIERYKGMPSSSVLTSNNIVSIINEEFPDPIYMWYDSEKTTIYWYSEASNIYYNYNSSYMFNELRALNALNDLDDISSKYVTNMAYMFNYAGYNSTSFILNLGDKFDTSNVTNMREMFSDTGYNSTSFTLNLGDKFDTSNVTDMSSMFANTGYKSTIFTLDLGDKFDTSSVTNMSYMFSYTGYSSTVFTLGLGDKFDTSLVNSMLGMFYQTGYSSTVFTLDLGDKFDTSNVTSMSNMFSQTGYSSTVFTLDLGSRFDTSNVTSMSNMFSRTGYSSTVFTLDLGDKFDTSKVTNMSNMFSRTGYSSTVFTLDLRDKFDTSNVTSMSNMFSQTGYSSTVFTLDLGDKFDTSNVTNMASMFRYAGYNSASFTIDLGDKFDTSNVTDMQGMFMYFKGRTIYAPTTFVTTAVTSSSGMFSDCTNLVGGLGTTYSSSHINAAYAHIDEGTSNPGYFTARS